METARRQDDELETRVRAAGLRPTRQRIALAELLFAKGDRHLSAEELHEEALNAGVAVSLATVYNTLHQFTEAGLLRILALIGVGFALLTFVVGEYLAQPAERAAQQWRLNATSATVSQQLRSGLWVKDGPRFVNVRTVRPDRSMENIRIFEFDEEMAMRTVSVAERGTYDPALRGWRLRSVQQTLFGDDVTTVVEQAEIVWRSDLTPEVLSVLMVSPERMSVAALYAYIRHLHENRQSAERFEIALWKKVVYPFAALVMMALALPFAFMHDRMGAVSVKVFFGIMLGVGFHLLNGLFSNLGVINAWPPIVAAFTPSVIFLVAAGTLLYIVDRR